MGDKITYKDAGVDYENLDPFKRAAQIAARKTTENLEYHGGLVELEESRGESAYLIDAGDFFLAHVEEGLGTKNLVADAMQALTGGCYYASIAQDTAAMIVNDMLTVGARPISLAMHVAAGDDAWFTDEVRTRALIDGWKHACDLSECVWSGGETPTLRGVVQPNAVVLSGSGIGRIRNKNQVMLGSRVRAGDAIVILTSSGIHANGLSLARKVADKLEGGYLHQLRDSRTFGHALLTPTHLYVQMIRELQDRGIECHYGVNITGHGWRKLMRAREPFSYIIDDLPAVPPEFDVIQEATKLSDREMYGTFNMGAGFALILPKEDAAKLIEVASDMTLPYEVMYAGTVEASEAKRVVLAPKEIVYAAEDLQVR